MRKRPIPTSPLANEPHTKPKTEKPVADRSSLRVTNFRLDIPSIARYVARHIVKHAMDYEAAARELSKDQLTDSQLHTLISQMESAPLVHKFVEEGFELRGLDEHSKDVYVQEIWDWFFSTDLDLKMRAATILGKAFIADKIALDKPEPLPVEGLADAVASMLGQPKQSAAKQEPADDDVKPVITKTPASRVN